MRLRVPPPRAHDGSACAADTAPFFFPRDETRQRRLAPALGVRPRQKRLDDARRRPRRGTRLGVTPRVPGVPGVTGASVLFDGSFRLSHLRVRPRLVARRREQQRLADVGVDAGHRRRASAAALATARSARCSSPATAAYSDSYATRPA